MRSKILVFLILTGSLFIGNNSYGQFNVIGYLPSWNGYPGSINSVNLTQLTHLNIAFANPGSTGSLSMSNGTLSDLATVVTTAHSSSVKVLVSIGGSGAPGSTYANLIATNQAAFVDSIVNYAVKNNLDGIDVDIEGDVLNGTTLTSAQYQSFVTALGVALHAQSKIMTAALATWFGSFITNAAASQFDIINIMSYDLTGTWTDPGQHSPYSVAVSDIAYWNTTKGVTASKLALGVPFYGYFWGSFNNSYDFNSIVASYPSAVNQDEINIPEGGVYYYNGIPTIKEKTSLAMNEVGGIMIWQLTGDATGANSLLTAIHQVVVGHATNIFPTVSITAPTAGAVYTEGDTIQLNANATDSDGSIIRIQYFAGSFEIGELYNSPYTLSWSGVGPGTYTLRAVVMDNMGDTTSSSTISITVHAAAGSLPFTGAALPIPGKIEAENFNLGGNNVAYYDNTAANLGGAYRASSVDIEGCIDTGGGYDVGWTAAGEWLEYSVNVIASGKYDFQARVASPNSSKTFYIEIDGTNVTGNITVPNTTDWQKWQTVTASGISLVQGQHKMRFMIGTGGYNLNFVNVVASVSTGIVDPILTGTQNYVYPNPFAQSATVRFNLKNTGPAKVTLLDQLGREVMVIANQPMTAGFQEVSFQNNGLQKGSYVCLIHSESETIAIQVLVE
ncbi:MAG TPA: glycosyl hydrolase family 18 protein [Cytophagaceae bacterium]|jgi:chitinase|nr:glycosyl hydrolase family 18 protein [Cytophagaceae bacterium]